MGAARLALGLAVAAMAVAGTGCLVQSAEPGEERTGTRVHGLDDGTGPGGAGPAGPVSPPVDPPPGGKTPNSDPAKKAGPPPNPWRGGQASGPPPNPWLAAPGGGGPPGGGSGVPGDDQPNDPNAPPGTPPK